MTKERLQCFSDADLGKIASGQGIINFHDMDREELVDVIVDAFEESRLEHEEESNWTIRSVEKKFDIFRDEELEASGASAVSVPEKYNVTKIRLIMVNPLMAFVFWELNDEDKDMAHRCARKGNFLLRVHEKQVNGNSDDFFDIPVKTDDKKWYINLPSNGCTYHIELVCRTGDTEKSLGESNSIDSPLKISGDIMNKSDKYRDDFMVLAGVYGFYDDEDGDIDNSQRIITFLNAASIREGV